MARSEKMKTNRGDAAVTVSTSMPNAGRGRSRAEEKKRDGD